MTGVIMIREQDVVVFQGCGDERSALGPSISHPVIRNIARDQDHAVHGDRGRNKRVKNRTRQTFILRCRDLVAPKARFPYGSRQWKPKTYMRGISLKILLSPFLAKASIVSRWSAVKGLCSAHPCSSTNRPSSVITTLRSTSAVES